MLDSWGRIEPFGNHLRWVGWREKLSHSLEVAAPSNAGHLLKDRNDQPMRPCAGQRRHLREQAFPLPRGVASGSQNGKLQFGATGTRRTGSATQCDLMTAPAIAREGLVVDLLGRTWSAWRAAGVVSRSGRPQDSAPDSDKVIALGWDGREAHRRSGIAGGDIGRSGLPAGTAEAWDLWMATPLAFWLVGTENLR